MLLLYLSPKMSTVQPLREIPDLPEDIIEAGKNGELVLFVGAGVSMLLDLPSWDGLAEKVLEDLRKKKYLTYSDVEQLRNLDAKKKLSIADLVARENNEELNIIQFLPRKDEGDSIYKTINDIGCVCVTTNYDELLSPRFLDKKGKGAGESVAAEGIRIYEKDKLLASHLNVPGTVIHLHGAVREPRGLVVTTKDYLAHYDDEMVQHFLGQLFKRKTVLFLGYGLEEAEMLEHILRRGGVGPRGNKIRFMLHPFYNSQAPLYQKIHQYYEKSFGVDVLGYVRDFRGYQQLESIMVSWAPQLKISKPAIVDDLDTINEVLDSA